MINTINRKWIILINVCLGIFMATLDGSIVNIALPEIAHTFNMELGSISWIVSSYILTISCLLLIFGRLCDIYGKKNIYALGYLIFTISSLLCGTSNSFIGLVISRVLQGIGAAIIMANSQAIITENFEKSERGRALGISGTFVAFGSLTGPGIGGYLVYKFGYQSIFLINIPFGIIGILMTLFIIPKSTVLLHEKFDYIGGLLHILTILLFFVGMFGIESNSMRRDRIIMLISTSLLLFILFVMYEKRQKHPIVNLEIFKRKSFTIGILTAYISFLAMFTVNLLIPFYLNTVLNYPTNIAGVIIMFYPATLLIFSSISGILADRIGTKTPVILGLTINFVGLFMLSQITVSTGFWNIALKLGFLGIGTALFQSPNNTRIMNSVKQNMLGVAAGMNSLVRNLGMISGIIFGIIISDYYTNKLSKLINDINEVFTQSIGYVFKAGAALCILAVIFTMIIDHEKEKTVI